MVNEQDEEMDINIMAVGSKVRYVVEDEIEEESTGTGKERTVVLGLLFTVNGMTKLRDYVLFDYIIHADRQRTIVPLQHRGGSSRRCTWSRVGRSESDCHA